MISFGTNMNDLTRPSGNGDAMSREATLTLEEVEKLEDRTTDYSDERGSERDAAEYEESKEHDALPSQKRVGDDALSRPKSHYSLHSHRSYAGGDGYTCFSDDPECPNIPSGDTAADVDQQFVVTWDGDSDPMNPRSMTKLRRWIIIVIVSSCSLCV